MDFARILFTIHALLKKSRKAGGVATHLGSSGFSHGEDQLPYHTFFPNFSVDDHMEIFTRCILCV